MPLKKFFKTKFNASTDYLIIFVIINLSVAILSVASGFSSYKNNLISNKQLLQQDTIKAGGIIQEAINEHSWQIRSLADKIMKAGNNLEEINQIISNYNKFDLKSNFDQFLNQKDLYWVDNSDNVVIKNKVGILKYPKKISNNYEVFNSKINSWKLIISKNNPYFQNDYNLILTSFGVTDSNGKYLGSIVSSIDINPIQNLLIKNLSGSSNNLVILNSENNKIVFQSNPKNFVTGNDFFTHKLGNINYEQNQDGQLDQEILEHNIKYSDYKKLTNYPLVILSGYDYSLYKLELLKLLLKTIYPSIAIGALLLITLFLFYKRIVQPIKILSNIARKIGSDNYFDGKFPRKISSPEIYDLTKALLKIKHQRIKLEKSNAELTTTKTQLEEAIEIIKKSDIAQIEITKQIRKEVSKNTDQAFQILNMIKHNLENGGVHDNKINLLLVQNIEQEIINITKFATDELNKGYVDIRHIVDIALLSQEKEIKIRNIKLEINYEKSLPKKVLVDQIRLIQIFSGILYKTIKLLSEGHEIKIDVRAIIKNKSKYLSIKIQDNGIGIGIKEYIKDMEKFGGREEGAINGIDIAISTIEEMAKLHRGEIIYNNKIGQGSSTTVIIPCVKKERKITQLPAKKVADNIIYFPLINQDS